MAQQKKVERACPNCGASLKKTIGAQSRRKFWVCTRSENCFKEACAIGFASNPW